MKVDTVLGASSDVDVRAQTDQAEFDNYDGVWVPEITHDAFTQLTLAATASERLTLGSGIAVAFARNPMSLAVQANDVQLLSRGRLALGLGSQVKPHITRRYGMPWSHPAARMREFVLALHAIWASWEDGSKLDFRGEFYSHTLMTPFFSPGPNPYGRPRVLLAGVGELMTKIAGEVADGFLPHGFTTERYLREVTLPALGTTAEDFEISGSPFVATGRTEQELAAACDGVRAQIAFYASTPAYRPVLDLHGWGALADELHTLSVSNRWSEMGPLVDDEVLGAFAVVGEPDDVPGELLRRYGELMTRMSFYTPYEIDGELAVELADAVRGGWAPPRPADGQLAGHSRASTA